MHALNHRNVLKFYNWCADLSLSACPRDQTHYFPHTLMGSQNTAERQAGPTLLLGGFGVEDTGLLAL